MSKKTKIDSVRISIKGQVLELTIEELKELRDILCEAFPKTDGLNLDNWIQPIVIKERTCLWKYWYEPTYKYEYSPSTTPVTQPIPKKSTYWIECKS